MRRTCRWGMCVVWALGGGALVPAALGQGPLAAQLAVLAAEPAVARAHWGVIVTAMDGAPIYQLNAAQFFQPASNAKLFTTAAAVHLLGTQRRFMTVLEGPPGSAHEAILHGNLTLRGSGDANLSGREVPYLAPSERPKGAHAENHPLRYLEEMADALVAAGVQEITGDIVGDDTAFPWEPYAPDWAADDLVWGYGAPVSALTVTDNQLLLKIRHGAKAGDPATMVLEPATLYYELQGAVGTVAAKSADGVQVQRPPGSKVLMVSGTIAADAPVDVEEVAIQDPAEFAAMALKSLLEARGIVVGGIARAEHRLLPPSPSFLKESREPVAGLTLAAASPAALREPGCSDACPFHVEHTSPTLIEDVVVTNKVSQNLHAELLLRQLGKAYGRDGSIEQGARVVRQFLINAGIDKDDFVFYDGSGLSGHDLVTPRAAARLLQFASTQPWFTEWRRSLPVGGVDGSLAGRFATPALRGHVFAKTGTLGEARALSGYLECASGRTVIFSIMVSHHAPGTGADRDVMDRMAAAIAADN